MEATLDSTVQKSAPLGHPCRITQARAQFAHELAEATVWDAQDPMALNGQIARALMDLRSRMTHVLMALDVANSALPEDTDSDDSRSILTMAEEFSAETADRFDKFAGQVLAQMEKAAAQ